MLPAALAVTAARLARAQQTPARETEIGVSAGLSGMPDALSTQCGSRANGGGDAGGELGLSLLRRLGYNFAVQADTRLTGRLSMFGCRLVLPPIDTGYAESLSRRVFATSTIRLAVETPASMPLFRLSSGYGLAWGGPTLPVRVIALAWSTRGERKRLFVEVERLQTRVDAEERDNMTSLPGAQRPIVAYPVEHTLRVGLAWRR